MKSASEIGLKITSALREYYRYTGRSADLERQGAGASRPELAWSKQIKTQNPKAASDPDPKKT
jgi:hypothetical protein